MKIRQQDTYVWEIPKTDAMNVPGKILASKELIEAISGDKSFSQVAHVAELPGIIEASFAMPDAHQGYGFPIGGVAAFDLQKGVISPGGVGYDINCSVRLLKTNLTRNDLEGKEKALLHSLFSAVPTGVGNQGSLNITEEELDEILKEGAHWMVKQGYGTKEDLSFIEEEGRMKEARPEFVSKRAKARGRPQIGSLGAGNHFLDVLIVDEVFDAAVAETYGLEKGQVVILIHCGSRGLGHQVASDYIQKMAKEYGFPATDRELVHAPITSQLGKEYLGAMNAAANFAFANKQLLTDVVRKTMKQHFPTFSAEVVYDVCHNIAKKETHTINGEKQEVLVLRKGATRSLGPGRTEIPPAYKNTGAPILIPGSMGTPSYVLHGTTKAEEVSMASTAHGAGRQKSRSAMKRELSFEEAQKEMEQRGVFVESKSHKGMIEENPEAYKDIEKVIEVSHNLGIGKKVARLQPLIVVIG